ncbi:RDD family protein [Promicromonospora umidemergens]|uniref:FHA domain-containing protein n=1 Tax=Promicromonospora umidemergens TaxID=629679 RepID=A0ABP8Y1W1_9MICO|nr:RDD family protein [Promicromonospora umidemergens]
MLAPGAPRCDRCEAPAVGSRPVTTALLASLAPASSSDRTLAAALDVGLVVLAAVPVVLGAAGVWPPAVAVPFGLVLVAGVAVLLVRTFRQTGGTPGALLTRTRYVDALVGTPPGPGRWPGAGVASVRLAQRRPTPPAPVATSTLLATPTPAPASPAPPQQVQQAQQPQHVPVAVLTDGAERIEVASTALLGRRPRPQPNEEVGAVVQLTDPTRSVSSTHALLSWDGATLWLVDRGSTNGSWVVRADGTRQRAEAGRPIAAPAGGGVQLGNRTFRVEAP